MMKVLVVDDSWAMRKFVQKQLKAAGLRIGQIYEAGDGLEALQALERTEIDFITTDIAMPEMNGLEFVKKVQEHPEFSRIPLIVISSDSTPERIHEMTEHGAIGFIEKPFTPQGILQELQRIESVLETLQEAS